MSRAYLAAACTALALLAAPKAAAEMKQGKPDLKSVGPLAFSPEGVLFVGDPKGAAIFAIDAKQTAGDPNTANYEIEDLNTPLADALGVDEIDDLRVNDMAVNPVTGQLVLSVSRGVGPDAEPVLLTVNPAGAVEEISLDDVSFAKTELPNPPEDKSVRRGPRTQNDRLESITDLLFLDGKLYVAGLSNEEFASKLRSIPFPFEPADEGASIEIFHGSHGQLETRSPVRTFAAVEIDDAPTLLAAYTCTPLVKIPIAMLKSGEKVQGETVAELGNHNRPLDMIVYEKGGEGFVLMANDARGVMKIPMKGVAAAKAINERIGDKAGAEYETLKDVDGVMQLDRLNADNVVMLIDDDYQMSLKTMALP